MGVSASHDQINASVVTSAITAESVPPSQMPQETTTEVALDEPHIPVDADSILQHHRHVGCFVCHFHFMVCLNCLP